MIKKILIKKDEGKYVTGQLIDSVSCAGDGHSCPHCSATKGRLIKALKPGESDIESGSIYTIVSGFREIAFSLFFLIILPFVSGFGIYFLMSLTSFSEIIIKGSGIAAGCLALGISLLFPDLLKKFTWPRIKTCC